MELEELKKKEDAEESFAMEFSKQLNLEKGGSNDENTAVTGEDNDAIL